MDVANVFFNDMKGRFDLNLKECEFRIECKQDILNYTQFISWYNTRLVFHPIHKTICDLFKKNDDIYLYTYPLEFGSKFERGTILKTKIDWIDESCDRPFYIAPFTWLTLKELVTSLVLNPDKYKNSKIETLKVK